MQGWPCETIQSWRGKVRHDVWGFVDSIALLDGRIFLIQNCSYGTLKAHREAIDKNPIAGKLSFDSATIELWEWRKKKVGRRAQWFLRCQTRLQVGKWSGPEAWRGPYDLYPKKA